MRTVDTPQLRARLAAGHRVWLVHATRAPSFRWAHLPGALAFPDVEQAAGFLRPDDAIVVYGAGLHCRASRVVAAELARRGFADVAWYADGIDGWISAGGHLEGRTTPGLHQDPTSH